MAQGLKSVVLKYEKFTSLQSDKLIFIYNTLKTFKKEFLRSNFIDRKRFHDYFISIGSELDLLQDVFSTCSLDLNNFLDNEKDIGCSDYLKIKDIQLSLDYLSNDICNKCLRILEDCINFI